MHMSITRAGVTPFAVQGYKLDIFLCAFDVVTDWDEPILRNPFWRCYLPVSEGASIRSSTATWPMRENQVLIIPPECPVSGHAGGPFTLFYAHFNCSITLMESLPSSVPVNPAIRAALDRANLARNGPLFRMAMLQLVCSAVAAIPATSILAPFSDRRTEHACQIMKENVDTRLSNAELAHRLSMSEASLLRLFRGTLGVSPQKVHLRIRLNHAAKLLQHTTKSIEQIADDCGFWDRNHFTRVFTREWNTSPGRYRSTTTSV